MQWPVLALLSRSAVISIRLVDRILVTQRRVVRSPETWTTDDANPRSTLLENILERFQFIIHQNHALLEGLRRHWLGFG